jgi:hypothetical protein
MEKETLERVEECTPDGASLRIKGGPEQEGILLTAMCDKEI